MQIPNNLDALAGMIRKDWKSPYYGALPYLEAMESLNTINDQCGEDSGRSIVAYFLANAQTWKGETARAVKSKLNQLLKQSVRS